MEQTLSEVLPISRIQLDTAATTWQQAIRAAGQPLVDDGIAKATYTEAMVEAVERLGPYIVLAPGVAIGHSRPEDGALELGFSLVRLARPVEFGSKNNDPVDLVFAFASPDDKTHLAALGALADFIEPTENLQALRTAETVGQAHATIKEHDQ